MNDSTPQTPRQQKKPPLKGRKQKYGERWSAKELKANIPILIATPAGEQIREMAAQVRRNQRTRWTDDWKPIEPRKES